MPDFIRLAILDDVVLNDLDQIVAHAKPEVSAPVGKGRCHVWRRRLTRHDGRELKITIGARRCAIQSGISGAPEIVLGIKEQSIHTVRRWRIADREADELLPRWRRWLSLPQ